MSSSAACCRRWKRAACARRPTSSSSPTTASARPCTTSTSARPSSRPASPTRKRRRSSSSLQAGRRSRCTWPSATRRGSALVEFLQRQRWTGLVFTAARPGGAPHEGTVPGTHSIDYAHLGGHERSPDIVFTLRWSSAKNRHGVPGADYNHVTGGPTGPVDVQTANHGSLSPWTVRNTMVASGPDFKRGATLRTPASNVDVAPTLLHLLGHADALRGMDGRPLLEALVGGPDEEQVAMETKTLRLRHGDYEAVLQVSEVEGKLYLDKGWRAP